MTKSIPTIEEILRECGPSLSSRLVKVLQRHGLTPEAARQRVSRAKSSVRRLKGIHFPKKESFVYLDEHFGKDVYVDSLITALKSTSTAAGRTLYGLESRKGAVPEYLFPVVAGAPISNVKKQLLCSKVLEQLENNTLVNHVHDVSEGNVILTRSSAGLTKRQKAVLTVEGIVLSILRAWVAMTGAASFDKVLIRGDNPIPSFGAFQWDLTAPSYLLPLMEVSKNKTLNGFIVADILLDSEIKTEDLKPFLYKCGVISSHRRSRPFIPIFLADGFELEALRILRKEGVLVGRPETLFGQEAAKALRELVNTIENAAAAISRNPDAVFGLIGRLSKIEGAALNLRSVVFELIVARIHTLDGYNIDIRQKVVSEMGEAEIDIKAVKGKQEVVCIECKGVAPGNNVKKEDIEEWRTRALPRIENWLKTQDSLPDSKRFLFCTSGSFDPDADSVIKELKKRTKRPVSFWSGKDVMAQLKGWNETSLRRIFEEHFKE